MSEERKPKSDLMASVNSLIDQSKNLGGGNAKYRERALSYYEGEVDIPPMGADHSKFVSRDVSDTIGLILPGLMRVFFGSNRIVDFHPKRQEHEAYHEHAADYVNHVLLNKCDGYQLFLYTFFDALLLGNGVIKYWWDDTPETIQKSFEKLTFEQVRMLESDPDHETIKLEEYDDPSFKGPTADVVRRMALSSPEAIQMAEAAGIDLETISDEDLLEQAAPHLPQPPKLYDLTIERTLSRGRLKAEPMPPESFLMSDDTSLDEGTAFAAHWRQPTRSELVAEGYDKKKVDALPRAIARDEEAERESEFETDNPDDDGVDKSTERVDLYECYVLVDRDGDGIAERWRIDVGGASGGRTLLKEELWEDPLPFVDVRTDPVPHRYRGRSIFDETDDVQDIKTVLTRGLFDNLYDTLKPQTWAEHESVLNPDELYAPTFGGVLWLKANKMPPQPLQKEFLAPQITPVLSLMDGIVEKRTGISQNSQALNIEALQNQSATAINAAVSATFSKIEQYARNLKECGGLKRFFQNVLKLLTKHQDWAEPVKLRKQWVPMKPSDWDPDMTAMVNTGLGTGSRERDFAMLQGMAMEVKGIMAQMGPYNEHANIGDLIDILHRMMEAGGISDPEQIISAIDDEQIKHLRAQMAKQPNPAMMKAQQEQQNFQQEMAMKDKEAQMEHARKMKELDQEDQRKRLEIELEDSRKREELAMEAQLTALKNAMGGRPMDTNLNQVG